MFRENEDKALLAAGFGGCRATAYRYLAEGIRVLLAQAPDLPCRILAEITSLSRLFLGPA